MAKEYQLWITLEEWEGADKICDVETCLLFSTRQEMIAKTAFSKAEELTYDEIQKQFNA